MAGKSKLTVEPSGPGRAGETLSKVPLVTLAFWIVKILATTAGETGGDSLSMTLKLGYLVSTLIFFGFFVVTLAAQLASKRYHPAFYWLVVVATTTLGTTTSDYMDRTLGLGYVKSSVVLLAGVILVLVVWHFVTGRIEFQNVATRTDESFYWLTILAANTLGTALGDFTADDAGLGFERGALLFAGLIGVVAALHFLTRVPKSVLFWAAYVLTRPLGATLGDTLTKPHEEGGFEVGRITCTLAIAAVMVIIVSLTSRRSAAPPQAAA
jgi:uncharacterized membrane-anchored protein